MTKHTEPPALPLFDFSVRWRDDTSLPVISPLFDEVDRIVRDKHQTVTTPDEWFGLLAALADLPDPAPPEFGEVPQTVPDMFHHPDLAGVELQAALTGVARNLADLIGLHADAYRIATETRDLMRLLAFRGNQLRSAADLSRWGEVES